MSQLLGTFVQQPEGFKAYYPSVCPKGMIATHTSPKIVELHTQAVHLLGKLDGLTQGLPDKDFFLLMYIRKDASASSQIEGTRATLIDAVQAESVQDKKGLPKDVDDILHYIEALNFGIKRIKEDEFPMSLRLLKEMHGVLMQDARATHHADPGNFRTTQNWIGGTKPSNARFVPPPVNVMKEALNDLENFIHSKTDILPLVKIALLHAQFETIHPFLDGNGRIGRLLISLEIWQKKYLEEPILFLSSWFQKHQSLYYEKLNGFSKPESQIDWIEFFLEGIIETSLEAIKTTSNIRRIREDDLEKVSRLHKTTSVRVMKILPKLFAHPIVDNSTIIRWAGVSPQGASNIIKTLVKLDILEMQQSSSVYGKTYKYARYFNAFDHL